MRHQSPAAPAAAPLLLREGPRILNERATAAKILIINYRNATIFRPTVVGRGYHEAKAAGAIVAYMASRGFEGYTIV